jgi:hypothetical protein
METSLEAKARIHGIPHIGDFRELALIPQSYDDDKIFGLLNRYAEGYGEGLVIYGGITATERLYGLKRIREITNDLDFVCTPEGLEALFAGERLFYHSRFDVLYSVVDNVPVSFAFEHIHDWPVDPGFFAASILRTPCGLPVRCCSKEHSIMLKMRRSNEKLARGDQAFGKDALDIINIIAASSCRGDEGPIDLDALCALVRRWVSTDAERLARIMLFIRGYESHLSGPECRAAAPTLDKLAARFKAFSETEGGKHGGAHIAFHR